MIVAASDMPVPPVVFQLALQAVNGEDGAVEVMCDAILESGWYDSRVIDVIGLVHRKLHLEPTVAHEDRKRRAFRVCCERPADWFADAVVAVALFGNWAESMWAAVARCRYPEEYEGRIASFAQLTTRDPMQNMRLTLE